MTICVNADMMHIVTAPVIYSLIAPFVLLDIFVTVYQAVCFLVYRIERVKRSDYLIFDRINCAYCSYGNGLPADAREIAGRTEQYWCPIKHEVADIQHSRDFRRFAIFDFCNSIDHNKFVRLSRIGHFSRMHALPPLDAVEDRERRLQHACRDLTPMRRAAARTWRCGAAALERKAGSLAAWAGSIGV
jgi:hypothetical protein